MLLRGHILEVADKAKEIALNVAKDWYLKYQYIDFNSLEQSERDTLLSNLLSALAVLLARYEGGKQPSSQLPVDGIVAWFCSTYGWYYYSYQHDRIEKLHMQQLEAGKEPSIFNSIAVAEKALAEEKKALAEAVVEEV